MFAFTNAKEKNSPTVIGAGVEIIGDIKTDTMIQIHGIVRGKINAETVVIGRGARVVGRVVAKNLFLHGLLDGTATVDAAHIMPRAQMIGTLSYTCLNITNSDRLECKLIARKTRDGAKGCEIDDAK
ncbi:MAG: polymer-forming cytoskeletal protein [Rickettsiales bacterium]|jgi:cytoskeletal protein CcmA (bactofilin family)|nr:polymer-forming cytoskeletal protein [Rickettsiales bacterium]